LRYVRPGYSQLSRPTGLSSLWKLSVESLADEMSWTQDLNQLWGFPLLLFEAKYGSGLTM